VCESEPELKFLSRTGILLSILCSRCFKNTGLRREAAKVGLATNDPCPHCGSAGGSKLDGRSIVELFRNFYCYGSPAAMYLPDVFIEGGADEDDIQLEQSARADYNLLKEYAHPRLRRSTPHLPDLGLTDIRSDIDQTLARDSTSASDETNERLKNDLRRLLQVASRYEMQEGETLYRARISPARPLATSEFDSPPCENAIPNRIAGAGKRVLCGSFDIETCIFEIRPDIDDVIHHKIFVASLKSVGKLNLIDFSTLMRDQKSGEVNLTIRAFFEANQTSYHLTQLLSSFAKSQGYDGIVYPSAMKCTQADNRAWRNVAVFGAPIAEDKLRVESINRLLIRNVSYSFDLGPAWDDETGGNQRAPYLRGWLKRIES